MFLEIDFGYVINTFSTLLPSLPEHTSLSSKNLGTMHISLDNISFYSHPPPEKSLPVSCWKPYETPLAPRALSHAPLPRVPSSRTASTLPSGAWPDACAGFRTLATEGPDLGAVLNEFDIEIERIAMTQNGQVMHEADLYIHSHSELRNGNGTDVPQSQHTSLATGVSECLWNRDQRA